MGTPLRPFYLPDVYPALINLDLLFCTMQVLSHKLLDAEFSDPALRAFFIPFVSERFVRHGLLSLYRRVETDEIKEGV